MYSPLTLIFFVLGSDVKPPTASGDEPAPEPTSLLSGSVFPPLRPGFKHTSTIVVDRPTIERANVVEENDDDDLIALETDLYEDFHKKAVSFHRPAEVAVESLQAILQGKVIGKVKLKPKAATCYIMSTGPGKPYFVWPLH